LGDAIVAEQMLTRIYVDNFRCLVNFEFKPERVNLLVGANGSGKSTFLEALLAVRNIANGMSLETVLPLGSVAWWDRKAIQTFEFDVKDPRDGEHFRYRLRVRHSADSAAPNVEEESLTCGGKPLLTFSSKNVTLVSEDGESQTFGFEGTHSPLSAGMGSNKHLAQFRSLFVGISTFRLNPWAMEARSMAESGGLFPGGANFVDWIRGVALDDPAGYSKWQDNVFAALPHLKSLRLQDLGAGVRLLTGLMTKPGSPEQPIPFYDFSDGEKCLVVLHAIAATRRRNFVLSLDEPDNFLSLRELQPVLTQMIESSRGIAPQLFVASHHPESIDYLAADSTWIFERPAGAHVRVRPLVFDRAKGERASELVRAELL
jgi:predicted ATPase